MSEYEDSFASESQSEEEKAHSYTSSQKSASESATKSASESGSDGAEDRKESKEHSEAASSSRASSASSAAKRSGSGASSSRRESTAASSSRPRPSTTESSAAQTTTTATSSRATTADSRARAAAPATGDDEYPLATGRSTGGRKRSAKKRGTARSSSRNRSANSTAKTRSYKSGASRSRGSTNRSVQPDVIIVEEAKVPETQDELEAMLEENERLKDEIYEKQRDAYRSSMKRSDTKPETRKEEAARLVQEALMLEREAQILRQEKRDLLLRKERLADLIRRYKKARQYAIYVEQAKEDIATLSEDHRDMQLEVRMNEKLLVMHEEVLVSGKGDQKLAEELRAQNALTQRAVQHALRDADDAQRQRDAQKSRTDALQQKVDQRAKAMSSGGYDELSRLRMDNRDAAIRIDQLKRRLGALQSGGRADDAVVVQTSDQAESDYLKERIAEMRMELRRAGKNADYPGSTKRIEGKSGGGGAAATTAASRTPAQQQHEYMVASGADDYYATQPTPNKASGASSPNKFDDFQNDYSTGAGGDEDDIFGSHGGGTANAGGKEAAGSHVEDWLGGDGGAFESTPPAKEHDAFEDLFGGTEAYPTEAPAVKAPAADDDNDGGSPSWLGGGGEDWMTADVGEKKKPSIVMEDDVFDAGNFNMAEEEEVRDETGNELDDLFGEPAPTKTAPAAPAAAAGGGGDDMPDWLAF